MCYIVVLGVVGPEMAMDFGSKEVEPRLMRGHVLFLGTVKNSLGCLIGPKMSMCYLHDIA